MLGSTWLGYGLGHALFVQECEHARCMYVTLGSAERRSIYFLNGDHPDIKGAT